MKAARLQKLLEFSEKETSDPFLKYALATEYLNLGDTESALKYFEDLVLNHEDYVGTYYHLGKLYEGLERTEDALKTYQKGMDVASRAGNTHTLSELQAAYRSANLNYEDD
ncbi:tetratricopeptide repeat protein [Arcticibacter tournemirensis]|uniref:Tetratricopeptide repeat protein n=1 Tax=Arcticibacter tournemirensis TaxID=699437 RepID=A0A5M9H820_9SPHI|nr:tetratricopeptide repeat protein [Arcticibacter tournemirensis]KAA8482740.1 tetratricopeptide repeat protein [Arcticibacter tournemirensis]TQM51034.1 tetratricopeptide repeat protein [Arcticibacter tournemirensis]